MRQVRNSRRLLAAPRQAGRGLLAAVVALVAVPTVCVAGALALLVAPRVGAPAAGAIGLGYAVLAAVLAPLVLRLYGARLARSSMAYVRGFEAAAIGMAILTPELRLVRANDSLCRLLGRRRVELVGRSILDFTHPDDVRRSVRKIDTAVKGDQAPLIKRYLRPDGSVIEMLVTTVFVEPPGEPPYFFSQLQDVTEQRQAERRSAAIADLGRRAAEADVDPVTLMEEAVAMVRDLLGADSCAAFRRMADGELRLAAASTDLPGFPAAVPADASQTGYTLRINQPVISNDLLREDRFLVPAFVFTSDLRAGLSVPVPERRGVCHVLLAHAAGEGRRFTVEDTRFLEAVAHVVGGALDHAATEDELRRRAFEDPLTGLANRALLLREVERELRHAARQGSRTCLLLLDLDRFKLLNDSLGHSAGDTLLQQVALRLRASVREEDLVARPGGDEFVVLSTRADSDGAVAELGRRLVEAFAEPFAVAERTLSFSASIGVAVDTGGRATPDELLRDADAAMYRAKETGGGRFEVFDAGLRRRLVDRLTAEQDLRHAVERGQLELHYQPLVELATERLVGFEALLRWRHPARGLVAPEDFIGIAEETGLIVPIGSWVLETACAQLARWPASVTVSANLSPAQVTPGLVDEVAAVLARFRVDPGRLVLEITESLVLEPRTKPIVSALRALGVRVALDDFGTGYSSLGSLQRFPLDVVKLDRSLVEGLDEGTGRAVLSAAVELGRALRLNVVAEGIERPSQLGRLRDLGCLLGQGFLFAQPMTVAEAEQLLAGERREAA